MNPLKTGPVIIGKISLDELKVEKKTTPISNVERICRLHGALLILGDYHVQGKNDLNAEFKELLKNLYTSITGVKITQFYWEGDEHHILFGNKDLDNLVKIEFLSKTNFRIRTGIPMPDSIDRGL